MTVKSPFYVIEHFISPSWCDVISSEYGIKVPTADTDGQPLKHERFLHTAEATQLQQRVQEHVGEIENRYGAVVANMETPLFQQWFENPGKPCQTHGCENAKFLRKKWVKTKDVDLVGYLWLKDFNSGVPLDPRYETYGGKLEFPAYNFSLVPQRGTLVLYPAGPHFISAISPVLVGSLEQIKITVKLVKQNGEMYLYQPSEFPGTYQSWFTSDND